MLCKKTSRKPMLFFFIQRHWFLPVLVGCYDILMDVIICDTLWYLIRPIGRLLKIAFCEMWGIIFCSQCRAHVKDYVSKAKHQRPVKCMYVCMYVNTLL